MVVPAQNIHVLPDNVDFQAGALTDAGSRRRVVFEIMSFVGLAADSKLCLFDSLTSTAHFKNWDI